MPTLIQTREVKSKLPERYRQEAWTNVSYCELEIPQGETAETYIAALYLASRYSGLRWFNENGKVIEEAVYSIGD